MVDLCYLSIIISSIVQRSKLEVGRLLALQQLGDNLVELSVRLLELGRRLECRLQGLDSRSNALEVKLDESQVLQVRDERHIGGSQGRANDVVGLLEEAAVVAVAHAYICETALDDSHGSARSGLLRTVRTWQGPPSASPRLRERPARSRACHGTAQRSG